MTEWERSVIKYLQCLCTEQQNNSEPDVALGPAILVLQHVGPGGSVTPDHVADEDKEREQTQTDKLEIITTLKWYLKVLWHHTLHWRTVK